MTLEQEIYQKLDTFTGNIKAFLKGSIHTTYKSSMHAKDLEFNTLEDNRLKIGFTTDHYSDPMFYINVDPETETARVYNIETPGTVLSLRSYCQMLCMALSGVPIFFYSIDKFNSFDYRCQPL